MIQLHYKNIARVCLITGLILMVPLVVMAFTDEVVWGGGDFLVAALLLIGFGTAYSEIARRMNARSQRLALGLALASVFALIWIELAVGLF